MIGGYVIDRGVEWRGVGERRGGGDDREGLVSDDPRGVLPTAIIIHLHRVTP